MLENYYKKKGIIRSLNIFFAILYMVVYTTPFFRYVLGSRFRIIGLGLLAVWFFTSLLRIRPRYVSKFCAVVLLNVLVFALMALVGVGNVKDIIAGYIAFWNFVFIFEVYLILKDYRAIRIITIALIVIICITGLTTIVASFTYPNISKNTYKDSVTGNNIANSLNVGGFDYIAGLSIVVPLFLYLVFRMKKKAFIVPLIICSVAVFMSGYTIDFLVLAIGVVMFVFSNSDMKLSVGKFLLAFVVLIVGVIIIKNSVGLITMLSNSNEHLGSRMYELQSMLNGELNDGTDLAYRIELYLRSLNSFLSSPLWGVGPYYYEGGHGLGNHSQIFDDLGRFGFISVIVYIVTIIYFKKWLNALQEITNKQYSLMIPYIQFLILSLLNPTLILPILGLVLFFVLPGIYFIDYKGEKYEKI